MNKIYGIIFGQCTPIIQSALKGFPDYENKSKDCYCLWLMEELKINGRSGNKRKPKANPNRTDHIFVTMN